MSIMFTVVLFILSICLSLSINAQNIMNGFVMTFQGVIQCGKRNRLDVDSNLDIGLHV